MYGVQHTSHILYTMNTFEIVAVNLKKNTLNILETGYTSYQEALKEREYWVNQYPHLWIEVLTYSEVKAMMITDNLKKGSLV